MQDCKEPDDVNEQDDQGQEAAQDEGWEAGLNDEAREAAADIGSDLQQQGVEGGEADSGDVSPSATPDASADSDSDVRQQEKDLPGH